jgi:hypothetical protein
MRVRARMSGEGRRCGLPMARGSSLALRVSEHISLSSLTRSASEALPEFRAGRTNQLGAKWFVDGRSKVLAPQESDAARSPRRKDLVWPGQSPRAPEKRRLSKTGARRLCPGHTYIRRWVPCIASSPPVGGPGHEDFAPATHTPVDGSHASRRRRPPVVRVTCQRLRHALRIAPRGRMTAIQIQPPRETPAHAVDSRRTHFLRGVG